MTPRSVSSGTYASDFLRQLADSKRPADKKFKSSAAPKGTKLAKGYVDRTQLRRGQGDEEGGEGGEKEQRVKALEEMVRLGQMDKETFINLRKEILGKEWGGDFESTHLVRGLDWKLLEKVRRGEDVSGKTKEDDGEEEEDRKEEEKVVDVDDEFEKLEEKEVVPLLKEEREKKGIMAPPPVAGKKRTRDEILKELKASRAAAAAQVKAPPQPLLGSKFRRIGEKGAEQSKRFVETDEKGRKREVLIAVDEDGRQKRKVRYLAPADDEKPNSLAMPDKNAKPLGMEVPEYAATKAQVEEEEDGDIFEGVGADYDPLAGIDDDLSSEDEDLEEGEAAEPTRNGDNDTGHDRDYPSSDSFPPEPVPQPTNPERPKPRNYFTTPTSSTTESKDVAPPTPFQDPTILAAIKRASAIHTTSDSTSPQSSTTDSEALLRRKKLLESASNDRDAQDMDMGFGSSKFGDDEEESFVGGGGKGGRKRGPKKRKGDKDSASDVLGVLEGRKGKSS
jgi:hypothetical protein